QRALGFELEHAHLPLRGDSRDLRAECSVPVTGHVWHPLEEVAVVDAFRELLVREEVVVHAVVLAVATLPRGCGNRHLEPRDTLDERVNQRALARAGRAGDDDDAGAEPALLVEEPNELGALPLGETSDRLRLADPALVQKPRRLHTP